MIDHMEYVAVYFQPFCKAGDSNCEKNRADILVGLEDIDSKIDEMGIYLVTTTDVKFAKRLGIPKLPCVGLFRNGDFLAFTGDLTNEINVLNWLSDIETLEINGVIEEVNTDMLSNIIALNKIYPRLRRVCIIARFNVAGNTIRYRSF